MILFFCALIITALFFCAISAYFRRKYEKKTKVIRQWTDIVCRASRLDILYHICLKEHKYEKHPLLIKHIRNTVDFFNSFDRNLTFDETEFFEAHSLKQSAECLKKLTKKEYSKLISEIKFCHDSYLTELITLNSEIIRLILCFRDSEEQRSLPCYENNSLPRYYLKKSEEIL